jgi:lipopolysaccharide O-acetyltransferase
MGVILNAPGLRFGPGCHVIGGRYVSFGRGVRANRDLWLEAVASYQSQSFNPAIMIGDYVSFSDSVHISSIESVAIGNHVLMGSRIYISDHNHGIYCGIEQSSPDQPPSERPLGGGGPVTIGDNVWIGDNVVILGPATIGRGSIIGANSLVRGMFQENCIVAGTPAKVIKVFNAKTHSWDRA